MTKDNEKPDDDFIERLKAGEHQAFRTLIKTYNQKLYRIARSIVGDDMEAQDVVQEAYIKVLTRIEGFEGADGLGRWLARITVNIAIDRTRKSTQTGKLIKKLFESFSDGAGKMTSEATDTNTPEMQASISQTRALLEKEIDKLPDGFREVFILRVVEEMSIEETADILQIPVATVKSRLHRARAKLQASIKTQLTRESLNVFPFGGVVCDTITAKIIAYLQTLGLINAK